MRGDWQPLTGASHRVALEILLDGPLSRAELAKRVGLSPGSLTRLTKPMIESGLLVEVTVEPADPRVGRPSQPLDLDDRAHHFAGVKLTADSAVAVLTTLRAEVIATAERPLTDHAPHQVAATVADLVAELTAAGPRPTGLGVALGGRVNDGTEVRWAPFLDWYDVGFREVLGEYTDLPAVLANDVTALTEATRWFGAGRGAGRFVLLTIGAGIGYGLVVHDRTVESPDLSLGPIGHHPLLPEGPRCDRGHQGCAITLLTSDAITGQISTALGRPVGYEECLDLATKGEPAAREVVSRAGRALGRLIAAASNFTLPERVVLGGEGVRLAEVAHTDLIAGLHLDRHPSAADPPIVLQPADFTEWARGAAVIAIQTFVLGTNH